MTTASFAFLAFGIVAALCYNLRASVAWRQGVLLLANLVFLGLLSTSVQAFVPLAAFLAFGYIALRLMQRGERNTFVPMVTGMIVLFLILAFIWLKKYTFLPSASFLRFAYVTLGLSYIFFRVLHLIIDAHSDALPHRISLISYLNYTLSFLTIVSGPIQRYQEFAETQLAPVRPPLTIVNVGESAYRIAIGFFKVAVLSLFLSTVHTQALGALSAGQDMLHRVGTGIIIAAAYPLYLYCNFSGYIDIVIGLGMLFRFRLPENFNRPFASENFMVFWNRWHITLSTFFKTYVYNPLLLVLMRRYPRQELEPFFAVFAFFVTFFLLGIWHGQTSVFVVYGFVLAFGVSATKLYQIVMAKQLGRSGYKELRKNRLYEAFSRGLTFTYYAFCLFWFWSNWKQMGDIFHALLGPALVLVWLAILIGSTILLAGYEAFRNAILSVRWHDTPILLSRYTRTVVVTAVVVITVAVASLLNAPAPDIVYKAF